MPNGQLAVRYFHHLSNISFVTKIVVMVNLNRLDCINVGRVDFSFLRANINLHGSFCIHLGKHGYKMPSVLRTKRDDTISDLMDILQKEQSP